MGTTAEKQSGSLIQRALSCVGDLAWRTKVALIASAVFDGLYAAFSLFMNHYATTSSMFLMGLYYLAIAAISVCLIVAFVASGRTEDVRERLVSELHSALVGGCALLVVNLFMVLITQRVLHGWSGIRYQREIFYVMLVYAGFTVFFGIMGWHRHRSHPSPIISTCKGVSLCKSLMTLLFVLVAAAHRSEPLLRNSELWQALAGTVARYLGVAASIVSLVIALFTIARSVRQLKAL